MRSPLSVWKGNNPNPRDEYGQRSNSTSRKLHLVEDNPNYKRFQIVSRTRRKINIRGGRGEHSTSMNRNHGETLDEIDDKDYLNDSYGPDSFDLNVSTLKKSQRKVKIIRNGKEFERELYTRD